MENSRDASELSQGTGRVCKAVSSGRSRDPYQGAAAEAQGARGSRRSQIQPLSCRFLPYVQEHPYIARLDPSDTMGCEHQRMLHLISSGFEVVFFEFLRGKSNTDFASK